MKLFDVYPLFDVNIVKGKGCKVWDDKGQEYLDLYGGHAVISIGHSHPHYISKVTEQLQNIGFYSNSVIQAAGTVSRAPWKDLWLRRLSAVSDKLRCRGQRECT